MNEHLDQDALEHGSMMPECPDVLGRVSGLVDNWPTIQDFRTAARVSRFVARLLDECHEEGSIWQRIFMEYPVKELRLHAGRFDDMADLLEASPQDPCLPVNDSRK